MNTLDGRLQLLGYRTYDAYLASPQWQATRTRILGNRARRCWCCPNVARDLHHTNYHCLGRETEHDLVLVCRTCHQAIHELVTAGQPLARAHITRRQAANEEPPSALAEQWTCKPLPKSRRKPKNSNITGHRPQDGLPVKHRSQ